MTRAGVEVRRLTSAERPQLRDLLARHWGSSEIVSRGRIHNAAEAEVLGAFRGDQIAGLATYEVESRECEVLTLNAFEPRQGIGSALLQKVAHAARSEGAWRLWLITTNDNLAAVAFYEAAGMRLAAIHRGAVNEARRLKPSIPELAPDGTPITDELEFELLLDV